MWTRRPLLWKFSHSWSNRCTGHQTQRSHCCQIWHILVKAEFHGQKTCFYQTGQISMSLVCRGRSLRTDYGFDRFGYAGRHWWSTVPWSLNLFAMLVLVGVRGNHWSIKRKSSLWKEETKCGFSCILEMLVAIPAQPPWWESGLRICTTGCHLARFHFQSSPLQVLQLCLAE